MHLLLFILGAAFGSFLNVVALRYDPDKFLFSPKVIGGLRRRGNADTSHCPHCGKALAWFELLPLMSFALQGGRCRGCRARISWRYPIVELACGLLFVAVSFAASHFFLLTTHYSLLTAVWLAVFATLLLMSLVDIGHYLIPDEIHVLLFMLGVANIFWWSTATRGLVTDSFISNYALLFRPGFFLNPWISHIAAAALGGLFFLALVLLTRGRGMGWGDVKLAAALGFLFGWPDILFVIIFGFLAGSIYGAWKMTRREKSMKSAVPFGPFLALGALVVMLWGNSILDWYFGLFGW